jgi:hypothetical protein
MKYCSDKIKFDTYKIKCDLNKVWVKIPVDNLVLLQDPPALESWSCRARTASIAGPNLILHLVVAMVH